MRGQNSSGCVHHYVTTHKAYVCSSGLLKIHVLWAVLMKNFLQHKEVFAKYKLTHDILIKTHWLFLVQVQKGDLWNEIYLEQTAFASFVTEIEHTPRFPQDVSSIKIKLLILSIRMKAEVKNMNKCIWYWFLVFLLSPL